MTAFAAGLVKVFLFALPLLFGYLAGVSSSSRAKTGLVALALVTALFTKPLALGVFFAALGFLLGLVGKLAQKPKPNREED